jgi:hypothetical protein
LDVPYVNSLVKILFWRIDAVLGSVHIITQGDITKRILYRADSTPIKRHVKILSAANPFLKEYVEYFEKRKAKARTKSRGTLLHLLPVQFDYWA